MEVGVAANGYEVSFCEDKTVLKLDCTDCTL